MARTGPVLVPVVLTGGQRSALEKRSDSSDARERQRARIVLLAADGRSNREIAGELGCAENTVASWRARFLDGGVNALVDKAPGPQTRKGRRAIPVEVTDEQRDVLERWTRRPTTASGLAQRARIVLFAAEGITNGEVAERVGCSTPTVIKWRTRFLADGLAGLSDEYRPGRPRNIADATVEAVIAKTLEDKPADGATQWSTRSMAKAAGLSQPTVSRIWRAFGVQPHRVNNFKLSTDPHFIDKVHDVVGLYLDPPERAIVICVDEKTGIQALDRTQPSFPMLPGSPRTATHDYIRHGTIDLFAALNIGTGEVITRTDTRHRASEFRKFLDLIADQIPTDVDVHVVLDNASTHKTPEINKWLQRHPRFEFHFTPTSSSWMNLVERWFAELTNKKLRRSAHRSTRELTDDIITWAEHWNDNPKPYVWHKTADEILESLKRYCQRISDSRH